MKHYSVQWLPGKGVPRLPAAERGGCAGGCELPGYPHWPRTSPLAGKPLIAIAERCSPEIANQPGCRSPRALPHPRMVSGSAIRKPERVPPQACPGTSPPGHPASHPPLSPFSAEGHQNEPGQMGTAGNSSQPSIAVALRGLAPQRWREPTPACEPAAPAQPREHGRLYFHCKLEINHSRKFPC